MRRLIKSPSAFKTCYIAQVREEMGFKVRRAHNRYGDERKHKVPEHLREYIEKAIRILETKERMKATYKVIQEKAFELYKRDMERKIRVKRFRGIFRDDPELVRSVAEDRELSYEID